MRIFCPVVFSTFKLDVGSTKGGGTSSPVFSVLKEIVSVKFFATESAFANCSFLVFSVVIVELKSDSKVYLNSLLYKLSNETSEIILLLETANSPAIVFLSKMMAVVLPSPSL